MTDRELMQQALEALDYEARVSYDAEAWLNIREALRERLAQHEALDKLVAIDQELGMFEQPVQEPPQFPTMLRKMWSGAEVQQWINEHWTPSQPVQEPVGWRFRKATFFDRSAPWHFVESLEGTEGLQGLEPLYTTPPRREWVGLTEEEIEACNRFTTDFGQPCVWLWDDDFQEGGIHFARAIEAKLREKNT